MFGAVRRVREDIRGQITYRVAYNPLPHRHPPNPYLYTAEGTLTEGIYRKVPLPLGSHNSERRYFAMLYTIKHKSRASPGFAEVVGVCMEL
ncbi:hypothetical protein J6590_039116 [Homalodisca vitripennis]|nr:hypothetical protein J6590_039116 [Homalodisca vitripennis]